MTTLDRYRGGRLPHTTPPTESSAAHKGSSPDTNWQTPTVSDKFRGRLARCPGAPDGRDVDIGAPCLDIVEGFCRMSGSPSFQPIKSQVTIPTAHVMPSTLGASPTKPCPPVEAGCPHPTSPSPSPAEISGPPRDGDGGGVKPAPGLAPGFLSYCGPAGANGGGQPWFPGPDPAGPDEGRAFDTPSIEPTLNQSAMMEAASADPRYRFLLCPPAAEPEPYKTLPEARPAPGGGPVGGERSRPGGGPGPVGLQPAPGFPRPLTLQPPAWIADPYTPHPPERVYEPGACRPQLESIQVQVEQMQLQNGPARPHPPACLPALSPLEPAQWLSVLSSNEMLLKEKEFLIDKQRQHICQLEQKLRESELRVQGALMGRAAPYGDLWMLRLQELQRDNTFLRAQFAQKTESLSREKVDLERKLAASEVEGQRSREMLKGALQKHMEEGKKQEERVKGRDKHINGLKKKCQKELEQNREKQQRIETLERYLAGLPTLEEHQRQSQRLQESELESADLRERVAELERELEETRGACREREAQLDSQKQRELELVSNIHTLQDEAGSAKKQDEAGSAKKQATGDGPAQPAAGPNVETESLQKERDSLRKVVDKQQKKMDQLCSRIKDLEQEVAQEEGTSQALKEEAQKREDAVQQLRTAMRELSGQNQDLIEKNLTLQERLRQNGPDQQPGADTAQLAHELYRELLSCLGKLQAVCSIITQRAQGLDPNLSLLLGIHSTQQVGIEAELQKPDVLPLKLAEVRQLHQDIEELRTTLSDRYAQDMGDNCIAQ
ncbi:centrosomal protein of 85 kDa [Tachyglossus aculeatus]|uniref:centrosomal protein of 85 kDa n=1 Tax=Tachyglossus aculeatus TaxID=9261 RepID=UPI0018F376A0|nr:centrosomal protein of 85 kDa [Tachyglossus aculeatus]